MSKTKVGIIFGGKSSEHEISIRSAKNVFEALDKDKYEPILIGIGKDGRWYLQEDAQKLLSSSELRLTDQNTEVRLQSLDNSTVLVSEDNSSSQNIDVVFPILHGTNGEDGTIQGLLKLSNIPFVGAGVLGSAVGMDKDFMKRLLRDAGIKVSKFLVFSNGEKINFKDVKKVLGLPLFVKPANNGSSVGVSKVKNENDFDLAIKEAFDFDNKIILEEAVISQEIECAVLGNESPIASVPGEIIPTHEFYDYEAKYIDENGAKTVIPANISEEMVKKVQDVAIQSFKVLGCEGMGRVDVFVTKNGEVFVNEINTIPGFTSISMYPKMWEASGIKYSQLIDRLISLAIERHKKEMRLKTSYT